jgi:hypothetical protein
LEITAALLRQTGEEAEAARLETRAKKIREKLNLQASTK